MVTPEELARYFYKYPLNAFPILDDAYHFSGLLLRRYVLTNVAEFKAAKTDVKKIIDKYVYYPNEGEIVRMIFGDKKIQEFPVLNRQGWLMGVWELSAFFRIFDKIPFSAFLNFRLIFDRLPQPVFIVDDKGKLMTFNRAMERFSGLEQAETRNVGRKLARVLEELGWKMGDGEGGALVTPQGEYLCDSTRLEMENGQVLTLHVVQVRRLDAAALGGSAVNPDDAVLPLAEAVERVEKELIVQALDRAQGNVSRASALLDIPRQTLQYKLSKYALKPELFT